MTGVGLHHPLHGLSGRRHVIQRIHPITAEKKRAEAR